MNRLSDCPISDIVLVRVQYMCARHKFDEKLWQQLDRSAKNAAAVFNGTDDSLAQQGLQVDQVASRQLRSMLRWSCAGKPTLASSHWETSAAGTGPNR